MGCRVTDNVPATSNQLEELAQLHEREAFALLVETVRDTDAKLEHRLKAAERILDQARGKPKVAAQKDPTQQKRKAVQMSVDTLLKIVQGAQQRTAILDKNRLEAKTLEGEFVPVARKRPVNEYQLPAPVVPGTKDDVDNLLS
jgi:hypothetical protein